MLIVYFYYPKYFQQCSNSEKSTVLLKVMERFIRSPVAIASERVREWGRKSTNETCITFLSINMSDIFSSAIVIVRCCVHQQSQYLPGVTSHRIICVYPRKSQKCLFAPSSQIVLLYISCKRVCVCVFEFRSITQLGTQQRPWFSLFLFPLSYL